MRNLAGTAANHTFRFTTEGKFLPAELHEPVRTLMRDWDPAEHGPRGVGGKNEALLESLGLSDYMIDRFTITGTPEGFIKRVEELAGLGVRKIRLAASVGDKMRLPSVLGDRVIPHFR